VGGLGMLGRLGVGSSVHSGVWSGGVGVRCVCV